jgi:hypothetical protein
MTTASMRRHARQRRRDVQATAAPDWRCGGLSGPGSQLAPRRAADAMATPDDGAPGLDGVTCEASEAAGVAPWLAPRRDVRVARPDRPWRHRRVEIPTAGGTVRVLGLPARRDRVVHGARTPLLEPSVAADGHAGSSGSRPQRIAPPGVDRVAAASVRHQTRVRAGARAADVDRVRHDGRRVKGARRVHDRALGPVVQRRRNAAGQRGVPPGGVGAPRRRHLERTAVEARREGATAVTANGPHPDVEDARDAAALGILVHHARRQDWRVAALHRRRRDALAALDGRLPEATSRRVARRRGARGGCVGVDCRRRRSLRRRGRPP